MLANTIQVRKAIREAAEKVDGSLGDTWTDKTKQGGNIRYVAFQTWGPNTFDIAREANLLLEAKGFYSNCVTYWPGTRNNSGMNYIRACAIIA